MGWQKTLPAIRAVWLLFAAQAIVAAVATDVGRTNEGVQPFNDDNVVYLWLHVNQHPREGLGVATRRS